MEHSTADFSVAVQGVKGVCPAGEAYAKRTISETGKDSGPFMRGTVHPGRKAVARQVADQIIATLKGRQELALQGATS